MSAVALDHLPGFNSDDTEPRIVLIPASRFWSDRPFRVADVYSIWQRGDWWRNRLGSRRAWSTEGGAEDSITLYDLNIDEWVDPAPQENHNG